MTRVTLFVIGGQAVLLLALLMSLLIVHHAQATQRAEDGSLVPDSFYSQTDYRPVTLSDTKSKPQGKPQVFKGKDCGGSWAIAYTEYGMYGETVTVDGTDTDALQMQDEMENQGWDNTIIYYLPDSCS